ncbi:arsenate reductase (thioredoxin) [Thermoanaerobacter mathranii subsp. mathranii str. A3]|uniref:Arsenate reductase (Thioredoxin) n=1 Tax=Thermoanaerobacter mathranii subsp. mathranii (strain DSM 11426 / CCUG 53645 / CIP 108742 / A3) TaxID=583358 RepID=A0ABM5LPN6_THEM3|nr:arsenate reductase (thioredoxin) [Thermoanaerobacter mathranii]ADH60739.1 arsenate reductase (thioredoxin) [Thermoanaerobacter mathranii subsp. mathranii str. A3]
MSKNKKILYFICTGNSCRSQMAEGFGKYYGKGDFEVYSGGVEAHGLNPKAVQVMKEIGIDISNQTSDLLDENILFKADYVITLCGDARDKCPALPPSIKSLHWDLEDPARATGTEEEVLNKFREIRDIIKENVKNLIEDIKKHSY